MPQPFITRLAVGAVLVLWALPAGAQTPVLDPRIAEFEASADHTRVNSSGQPVVARYDLEFYFVGASQPFQTNSLGKPTPDISNLIRVDLGATLTAFPPPGSIYEARVAAVGPAGAGRSLPSNQFIFSDPCAATLTPTGTSVGAEQTTGSVTVSVAAGCTWTVTSNETWVTISGSTTRTGSAVLGYSVAANTATSPRTATLTIAGQTFTIAQAAACTFAISPTSVSIASGARTGAVSVAAGAGCGWTATSSVPWITVASGSPGSGNGTVGYSVAANTSIAPRTGTLTIAGLTFTVTQAGVPCTASLSPSGVAVGAAAATGTIALTIPSGCAWTATDNATWVSLTSAASGTGSATLAYSIGTNTAISPRTAAITVAGQTFRIDQAGVVCDISISPTASSPTHAGGSNTVTVTATASACTWQAASNAAWIGITGSASGTGSGTVSYSVQPNTSASSRVGTISIEGETLTVTQAGVPCTYAISPTQASLTATGATGSIAVTAPNGCSWTTTSPAAWVTIDNGGSGSGNGTVTYTVGSNATITPRATTLTVAGQSFAISQAGLPCTYSLQPTAASVGSAASTGTVSVQSLSGCAWTASSNASWMAITAGQSGNGTGTVSYSVATNTTTSPRTGTLTIASQPFTVTQAGGSCTYTVSPASESFAPAGGAGSVTVSTAGNCSWTAQTSAAWITIDGTGSGSGNGTMTYRVAVNTGPTARSGSIAVGGRVVTISQSAACNYTLSPESVAVGAGTSTGSFAVAAAASCSWTASSSAAWLTLTGATGGTGNGTVAYRADANTGAARAATVTVGGRTFTLTQAALPCAFTLSTTSIELSAAASTSAVNVTTTAGCSWTAQSGSPWIAISGASSGTGNGTVTLSVSAHGGSTPRIGTVTIAGQTVTVTQSGIACTSSISPTSMTAGAGASQGSATIATGIGCGWTAASNTSWIALTSAGSGSGPATVTFSIEANPGSATRVGSLTIAGHTLSVTQAGPSCTFDIDPETIALGSEGGADSIAISASPGCTWTSSSSAAWIRIESGGSGTGNGTLAFSVAPNTATTGRVGTMTVAGRSFTVTQAGTCSFRLSPVSVTVGTGATSTSVVVFTSSGCTWTAASLAPWITVSPAGTRSGSGTVSVAIAANTGAARTGTAAIAGHTFTVDQSGCNYTVSPASASLKAVGGTKSAFIQTSPSCGWLASSDSPWITLSSTSGNGTSWVNFTAPANPETMPRIATLTIANHSLTVTQAAGACTYTVAPTSLVVPNTGGSTSVMVTTSSNCFWTASTSASWLKITPLTGLGSGTILLEAAPNPTIFSRGAVIAVSGKIVLLTQRNVTPPPAPTNLRIVVP